MRGQVSAEVRAYAEGYTCRDAPRGVEMANIPFAMSCLSSGRLHRRTASATHPLALGES